jgi:hypothetical protein
MSKTKKIGQLYNRLMIHKRHIITQKSGFNASYETSRLIPKNIRLKYLLTLKLYDNILAKL